MDCGNLKEFWREEERNVFKGWDFSHLKNRWYDEELPWDYKDILVPREYFRYKTKRNRKNFLKSYIRTNLFHSYVLKMLEQ